MPNRKLLFSLTKKDFKLQAFPAGGPGGQHQNKTSSAIRITHPASGAQAESRSERSQHQNKKLAFERLMENPKFKMWVSRMVAEALSGKTAEEAIDEQMAEENLRTEIVGDDGKWKAWVDESA